MQAEASGQHAWLIINVPHEQHQGSIFKVQTNDMERIIMSTDFIDELNALPQGVLSTMEAAYEVSWWKTGHLGRK